MLKDRIENVGDVKIGVLGLGYVGLPLAIKLADTGFSVIGIDNNADVVRRLKSGISTVEGIEDTWLARVLTKKKTLTLVAVEKEPIKIERSVIEELAGIDIFVICVPTPLKSKEGWAPDLGDIKKARDLIQVICQAESEKGLLPDERLVVLESSTYPGTTRRKFRKLVESHTPTVNWYLAYSPERMSPGPGAFDDKGPDDSSDEPGAFQITRVVGGLNPPSLEIASALFKKIYPKVHPVSSLNVQK